MDTITIQELIVLCTRYDSTHGPFPESEAEGKGVLMYILAEQGLIDDEWDQEGYDSFLDKILD